MISTTLGKSELASPSLKRGVYGFVNAAASVFAREVWEPQMPRSMSGWVHWVEAGASFVR